jgi:transposase
MYSIGIDVSKAKLDCAVLLDPQTRKFKTKVVPNSRAGITALLLWCRKQGIEAVALHAILEGTGVYHEQAAEALHEAGVSVSVVNPARVRNFAHGLSVLTKTDGVDARVLARFGALTQPAIWSPPSREARMLQALLARREALMQELQRELNRQEKAQATQTPPPILHSLQENIAFLRAQLAKLQHELDDHIGTHPELKEDQALAAKHSGSGAAGEHASAGYHEAAHFPLCRTAGCLLGFDPHRAAIGFFRPGAGAIVQGRPGADSGQAVHGGNCRHALQSPRQGRL